MCEEISTMLRAGCLLGPNIQNIPPLGTFIHLGLEPIENQLSPISDKPLNSPHALVLLEGMLSRKMRL